ncbi:hypothetical protein BCF55_0300 [Hydrogenivirga caldilitoris]|uniref:Transporter n=1 Tax=Hydrogenivirga caldilitoris TaxID=246264 RepID=A0A497XMI4_9AQUI|nr:AEC family transporter [Hydrogenivirga caldilitoris]RLJ70038.1 hypothetical protein BCF55_0300 [Hydrogenivirga caldilitoris]
MYERVLFVALIFLIAYVLKLSKVFKEEDSKPFINYVIYFSLPSLVLSKIRDIEFTGEVLGVVVYAWLIIVASVVLSFLVGKFLRMEEKTLKTFVLVSSFGNTAFLGYPFAFALFGDEGLRFAVLYDQLGSFLLVVSLGFLVATGKFSFKEVLLFPPFLALFIALLTRGFELPPAFNLFLEVSGKSLIPVVLFAIGLRFSPSHLFDSLRYATLSILVKMVVVPLVVLALFKTLGLTALSHRVVLLESAMPPMVMAGVLAIKYGLNEKLAVSVISLGILLSFITVPFLISFL